MPTCLRGSEIFRRCAPEVLLGKGLLKICSKFTGEHPCRSMTSIKLLCNFIEIVLRHGFSPVNLLHIFRTPFPNNLSGGPLLIFFRGYFLSLKYFLFRQRFSLGHFLGPNFFFFREYFIGPNFFFSGLISGFKDFQLLAV